MVRLGYANTYLICTTSNHHIWNHQITPESTKFMDEISVIGTCPQRLPTRLQCYYVIRLLCSTVIPKKAQQFEDIQALPCSRTGK